MSPQKGYVHQSTSLEPVQLGVKRHAMESARVIYLVLILRVGMVSGNMMSGDWETGCDCDSPGSQRYVHSCNGGGGIPGGISYFRINNNQSHMHETVYEVYLHESVIYAEISIWQTKIIIYFCNEGSRVIC